MKNKIIFALLIASFFCLFVAPHKVNAICNISINPSNPGAQEALDSCLRQQRAQDQAARDQMQLQQQQQNTEQLREQQVQLQLQQLQIQQQIQQQEQLRQQTQSTCTANAQYSNGQCYCNDGYIVSGTVCVTYNQFCQKQYGSNVIWEGTKNSNGDINCGCIQGFTWNTKGNACITNNQACQNQFGSNTNWDDNKNSVGQLNCDCAQGFTWNDSRTACIVVPSTPIASPEIINQNDNPVITQQAITQVSNPPSVKRDAPNTIKKVETESLDPTIKSEHKADTILGTPNSQINPEPIKKMKWYQKVWNWFMRK
ncbi:MAG: hypothetical protein NT094_04950 [Candidatus Staskawiczbacteria bacterium]|nr:hypothetical protein [Candidatus Staskawiczbacteria bacterium]